MKKSSDYIISKINEIQELCINVCVRYAYDDISEFHIIEISPESVRRGDKFYMEWEYNVWKEFEMLFPEEDLLISDKDEINDMSNLIYPFSEYDFTRVPCKVNISFYSDFACGSDADYSLAA